MSEQFNGTVSVARSGHAEPVILLNADGGNIYAGGDGQDGDVQLRASDGTWRIWLDPGAGRIVVRDTDDREVFRFDAKFAVLDIGDNGNEGDLRVRDDNGDVTVHIDGAAGDIKLSGADCAEQFATGAARPEPGAVVVIGDDGALQPSHRAYDPRVAGVVSGAGGLRPGVVLGHERSHGSYVPVALSGRVSCRVDAAEPIEAGDLLTTSAIEGHAMKASDRARAAGCVLGKALRPLTRGRDLLPILVSLQ